MCQQIKCVCVCVAINQEACARSAWCMVIMTILIRCKCVSRVHFTGSSRTPIPGGWNAAQMPPSSSPSGQHLPGRG